MKQSRAALYHLQGEQGGTAFDVRAVFPAQKSPQCCRLHDTDLELSENAQYPLLCRENIKVASVLAGAQHVHVE